MRNVFTALLLSGALAATAGAQDLTSGDFFDPDALQEIRLTLAPSDWETLRTNYESNEFYTCNFEWRGIRVEGAGVRSRGNFTRDAVKPGLHVDFNRFVDSQEFLGLKSVELKNLTQDASMLKDRLSMRLLRRMGIAAPRAVHAKVFVNGEYGGVYELVERIDKTFLKRKFDENDGYLYDYEWNGSYGFEYLGDDSTAYSPVPFEPRTHEGSPDPAPLVAMIRTINQASDAEFAEAMAKYLDLPLFLKQVAAENALGEMDGILGDYGMANFNLYRFEGKQRSQFIAWDRDHSFTDVFRPVMSNTGNNVLVRRALENAGLRRSYLESALLAAAMMGGAGGWLEQEIEQAYLQIRDAVHADPVKRCPEQPFVAAGPCTNERFEEEVQRLKFFARERSWIVRRQVFEAGFTYAEDSPTLSDTALTGLGGTSASPVPGSLVLISGTFPGVSDKQADAIPLPRSLGGVAALMNGFAAPIISVSSSRIVSQVPWSVLPGSSEVVVSIDERPGPPGIAQFAEAAPEILAVVHADGAPLTAERPATPGSALAIYAGGLGRVDRPAATGEASASDPPAATTPPAVVTLGGQPATVEFSGLAPGLVGVYQVNIRVPDVLPSMASAQLVVHVGGASSPPSLVATAHP